MENKYLKFWRIFAILLVGLNIILIVFLFLKPLSGRYSGVKEETAPGNYLVGKLKLTKPQQTELRRLRNNRHSAILELQSEGKKLRKIFFNGLTSNPVNSNVDSIANKIAENQKQIELVTYSHYKEVKNICTDEQMKIFDDIIMDVLEIMSKPTQPGKVRIHSNSRK
jgi:hypothetical protein